MKYLVRTVSVAAALGLAMALLLPGSLPAAQAKGVSRVVDNDTDLTPCKGKTDTTIGDALTEVVTAGGSGTITVCPGTYAGQVLISGVTNLKLIGKPGAKITPSLGGPLNGPIIQVTGSTNVTVQGFIIDGDGRLGTANIAGIKYQDTTGTIASNYISNIHPATRTSSCVGTGIYVDTAPAPVKIFKNTIYDYQCIGVEISHATNPSVQKNLLWATTSYGSSPSGINYWYSTGGSITSNSITSDWHPDVTASPLGIKLYESSNVKVSGNQINHVTNAIIVNAYGYVSDADNLTISANRITGVSMGIVIWVEADSARLSTSSDNNKITGNTFYAPAFEGGAAIWLNKTDDNDTDLIVPSLTNTTISGNKQYGFQLATDGKMVQDDSGGVTNYSSSNKTIPPPTGS